MNIGIAVSAKILLTGGLAVSAGFLLERAVKEVPSRIVKHRMVLLVLIVASFCAGVFWPGLSFAAWADPLRGWWMEIALQIAEFLVIITFCNLMPYIAFLDRWRGSKMLRPASIGRFVLVGVVTVAGLLVPLGLFLLIEDAGTGRLPAWGLRFLSVWAVAALGNLAMRPLRFPPRRRIEPSERAARITAEAAGKSGVGEFRLVVLDTREEKSMNVYSLGGRPPRIVLSSTALEELDDGELEAVILQGFALLKGRRLVIRSFLSVCIRLLFYSFLFDFATLIIASPERLLALLVAGVALLLFSKRMNRHQVNAADAAVLSIMGTGDSMASALVKLYRFNDARRRNGALTRGFVNHPDLVRRLRRLGAEPDDAGGGDPGNPPGRESSGHGADS